mmetsp:Transcript_14906/g.38654  ORF Transcript_14906/g.38654 Transcript_14906/m.38654 type:complete len:248 (+) Transcript_14906:379-1122(+)
MLQEGQGAERRRAPSLLPQGMLDVRHRLQVLQVRDLLLDGCRHHRLVQVRPQLLAALRREGELRRRSLLLAVHPGGQVARDLDGRKRDAPPPCRQRGAPLALDEAHGGDCLLQVGVLCVCRRCVDVKLQDLVLLHHAPQLVVLRENEVAPVTVEIEQQIGQLLPALRRLLTRLVDGRGEVAEPHRCLAPLLRLELQAEVDSVRPRRERHELVVPQPLVHHDLLLSREFGDNSGHKLAAVCHGRPERC